ncbi:MAG: hypothetical protein VB009_03825 [Erysipelotrichaceae bacterium]|nr:hypothetical protein [Erysipelotrichaceae bacterium]
MAYKQRLVHILLVVNLAASLISICFLVMINQRISTDIVVTDIGSTISDYQDLDLIYVFDPLCLYCQQTNDMIDAFIAYGYDQVVNIQKIDTSNTEQLIINDEVYELSAVPVLIVVENNKVLAIKEGVDDIFYFLDDIVKASNK